MKPSQEELKEISLLLDPANKEGFENLILQTLRNIPSDPIIEKMAWEALAKSRECHQMIEDLKEQISEEDKAQ